MEKTIKLLKTINGVQVYQITSLDERWYARPTTDKETGIPSYEFLPSSTWIAGHYPKGIYFYKWLAEHGWSEAEAIKVAAGDKGSKVHMATEDIDKGEKVSMDAKYVNNSSGLMEELSTEEYECILTFSRWLDAIKPQLLANEMTVFGNGYAGTLDRIYRIGDQIWIVDIKTGQYIWTEGELQISSYSHADIDIKKLGISVEEWKNRKLAILQLGYKRNKNGYKFTEIPDKFNLFVDVARKIFENENPNAEPKQRDLPLFIQSEVRSKPKEKKVV